MGGTFATPPSRHGVVSPSGLGNQTDAPSPYCCSDARPTPPPPPPQALLLAGDLCTSVLRWHAGRVYRGRPTSTLYKKTCAFVANKRPVVTGPLQRSPLCLSNAEPPCDTCHTCPGFLSLPNPPDGLGYLIEGVGGRRRVLPRGELRVSRREPISPPPLACPMRTPPLRGLCTGQPSCKRAVLYRMCSAVA